MSLKSNLEYHECKFFGYTTQVATNNQVNIYIYIYIHTYTPTHPHTHIYISIRNSTSEIGVSIHLYIIEKIAHSKFFCRHTKLMATYDTLKQMIGAFSLEQLIRK